MKFFFSIITSVFLFLGITPIALAANGPALNADRASTEYTASALNVCVNNRLQRGWELHGSLSVNFRPSNDILVEGAMRYTQALYKD